MPPEFTRNFTDRFLPSWDHLLSGLNERFAKGLEIGVYEGRSTLAFAERYLQHPHSYLITVNIPEWYQRDAFLKNVKPLIESRKVRPHYGRSFDVLSELHVDRMLNNRTLFDFIYVDGSHYSWDAYSDLCQAFYLLKVGGVLICDDYVYEPIAPNYPRREWAKPCWAIDAFAKCYAPLIEELPCHPLQKIFLKIE